MKLTRLYLFCILLASLIICPLVGVCMKEGFNEDSTDAGMDGENVMNTLNEMTGIPQKDIPNGEEDLYILKSQVVPPVCPACPTVTECPREKPCAPCPPCARCPEPSFECKKVPNYAVMKQKNSTVPRPVLSDFSSFGM